MSDPTHPPAPRAQGWLHRRGAGKWETPPPIPLWKIAAILLGFPAIHFVYSLALLHRTSPVFAEVDFFVWFWIGSTLLYGAKVWIVLRLLRGSGWAPADLGYRLSRRRTAALVAGYLAGALLLVALVELGLQAVELDPDRLARMRGLFPDTTAKRLVFILMAFAAGFSEEWVYRGLAIRALQSRGAGGVVAVLVAAIPFVFQHGIKSLDQFWWFLASGIALGFVFLGTRSLLPGIVIHWLIILSALFGIFSAVA